MKIPVNMRKKAVAVTLVLSLLAACLLSSCSNEPKKLPSMKDPIDDNYRIVYQIFVGSFSDSDGDGKGDLQGIIDRMDYLNDGDINNGDDLGVQLLWLSPVFKSPTYHKYDTTDYYTIDEAFGTDETLKQLVNVCHERNVKVILDIALNHTSKNCQWFQKFMGAHSTGNTDSEYYEWYCYAKSAGERQTGKRYAKLGSTGEYYECNFDDGMPELNYDVPAVREAMFEVCRHYIDLGVDGFRFDAAKYIYYGDNAKNISFWKDFVADLQKINGDVYTVGEVWSGNSEILSYYEALNCFDFTVSSPDGLLSAAANGKNGQIDNFTKYICTFTRQIEEKRDGSIYQPFISNHDMDRASGYVNVSSGAAYMAANLLLLGPGSPVIYYGEEIAMKGSRGTANTDANRRLAMLWGDGDTVKDPTGTTFESSKQVNGTVADQLQKEDSILRHYEKVIALRNKYPAIARGSYSQIDFESSFTGGFDITYEGGHVAVIHNTGNLETTIDLSEYGAFAFTQLLDYAGTGQAELSGTKLTLGAKTSAILG